MRMVARSVDRQHWAYAYDSYLHAEVAQTLLDQLARLLQLSILQDEYGTYSMLVAPVQPLRAWWLERSIKSN